jgi:hypothetical protein
MVNRQAVVLILGVLLRPAAYPARSAESESAALLKRVILNVAANDAHIENYTCIETVRRDYYEPAASTLPRACSWLLQNRTHPTPDMILHLEATDRLRLDVTTTERGEIFSWAGANRFDDTYVDNVVRDGPIASGAFGAYLSVIFQMDAKRFTYEGNTTVDGRRLAEYSFEVSLADSHYKVKLMDGDNRVSTAYSGNVLVDPETADPVHLTVRTAELPPATGSCQSTASLDFTRVKIADHELLLPSRSQQHFVSRTGQETENTTIFTSCREYSSESTVNFFQESGTQGESGKGTAAIPQAIRSGLRLAFQLTKPIEADSAAAGDRFTAKLSEALRDGRQVLAPKGALVEGRITMVKTFYHPKPQTAVGLSPRYIEIRGTRVPLSALLDYRAAMIARAQNRKKGLDIVLPPRGEASGIFLSEGRHVVFRTGFLSEWITAPESRTR